MNKDYSTFKTEDFLQDEYFIHSIKHPSEESEAFWKDAIALQHVSKEEFELAKRVIKSIRMEDNKMSAVEFLELKQEIEHKNLSKRKSSNRNRILYAVAAACIAALIAIPTFLILDKRDDGQDIMAAANAPLESEGTNEISLTLSGQKQILIAEEHADIHHSTSGEVQINEKSLQEPQKMEEVKMEFNRLIVPLGKRSMLTLSDGTKLWINAGTRVVYPVAFSKNKREIYVSGEVYMEVTRDENAEFIVRTDQFDVKVLGTSFNICTYKEIESSVVLLKGAVKVKSSNGQSSELKPNQRIVIGENGLGKQENVNAADYIGWINQMLILHADPLHEVMQKLKLFYGVDIEMDDSSKNLLLSGKLDLKDDINNVILAISKTTPITYSRQEGKIRIRYKNP